MRRLLPLAVLAFGVAGPASAQVVPSNLSLCGGRVTLSSVETRAPAMGGGGITAQIPARQGNWEYYATFANNTPQPLTISLVITGDVGQRASGPQTLRPGANPAIMIGVKPAGGFGPPMRGEALVQVIRVGCP